jgi:hypothetical protein
MKNLSNHIAVWMDHSIARLIYPKGKEEYSIESMLSPHDIHPREDGQHSDHTSLGNGRESNNEYSRNHKENDQLHEFYHALQKVLVKYDVILLFGPTKAKDEFFNILMKDHSFDGKKISVENSDKLTDHQLIAFVKNFFTKKVLL